MSASAVLRVHLTPRSHRDEIVGADDGGDLRVRVSAPPVDGAANKALVKVVAKALGVPRGAVSLVGGATGRHKRLRIEGVSTAALEERWPGLNVAGD